MLKFSTTVTSDIHSTSNSGTGGHLQFKNYLNNYNGSNNQFNYQNSYTTSNNALNNTLINGTNGGMKSPSADSLSSNKSVEKPSQNNNNNNTISQAQSHTINNTSTSNTRKASGPNESNGASSTAKNRMSTVMTPEMAMKQYMSKLTTFEHHEIFNYPEIYFLGQNAKKIHGVIGGPLNNGFDDENGSYKPVQHDQILYRYEVLKILGKFENKF